MKPILITFHNGVPTFHDVTDAAVQSGIIQTSDHTGDITAKIDPEESRARASLEPGWTWYGRGPLKVLAGGTQRADVVSWHSDQWLGGSRGASDVFHALRTSSPIAVANGLTPQPPALPDGVPDPGSEWIYAGGGPIKGSTSGKRNPDILMLYAIANIWNPGGASGSGKWKYALRRGSAIHRTQIWFHESQLLPAAVEGAYSPDPIGTMTVPDEPDYDETASTYPPPESEWPVKPDAPEGCVWERMPVKGHPESDDVCIYLLDSEDDSTKLSWRKKQCSWEGTVVFRAVPAPVTDPEWRELREDEVITHGDDVAAQIKNPAWVPASTTIGFTLANCAEPIKRARRRVTPSQAKETTVGFPAVGTKLRFTKDRFNGCDLARKDDKVTVTDIHESGFRTTNTGKDGEPRVFCFGLNWRDGLEIVEPAPLKLEVGKFYVNRKDEVVGPVEQNSDARLSIWKYRIGDELYQENGLYTFSAVEHREDLIREHTEPEQEIPATDAEGEVSPTIVDDVPWRDMDDQEIPTPGEDECSINGSPWEKVPGNTTTTTVENWRFLTYFDRFRTHRPLATKPDIPIPSGFPAPVIPEGKRGGVESMRYHDGQNIELCDWVMGRHGFTFDAQVTDKDAEKNLVTLDRKIGGKDVWETDRLKLVRRAQSLVIKRGEVGPESPAKAREWDAWLSPNGAVIGSPHEGYTKIRVREVQP